MKNYCLAPRMLIRETYPDGTPTRMMPFALPFTVFGLQLLSDSKKDGSAEIAIDGIQTGSDGRYYDVDYILRFHNATVLRRSDGTAYIVTSDDGCEIVSCRVMMVDAQRY